MPQRAYTFAPMTEVERRAGLYLAWIAEAAEALAAPDPELVEERELLAQERQAEAAAAMEVKRGRA
ncbi:hypothetical protein [Siccirubricoccus phaeus]|uniref:hypothetical protein n=1 Tax=Siccirubricoccus phaeus TaxID=2595053 RepID=UPI0011F239A2|nr:hypothetical protein [Siccirubricoccus phaeus]